MAQILRVTAETKGNEQDISFVQHQNLQIAHNQLLSQTLHDVLQSSRSRDEEKPLIALQLL